jgi:protein tyrosine/serine phosphatase
MKKKIISRLILIVSLALGVATFVYFTEISQEEREVTSLAKHKWAQKIEKPGLPNFYRVTEDLYRGAQPTAEGMRQLKAMGIKTVINLRSFHSDLDEIGDTDLAYEHIYMKPWHPEEKEVVRFLQIVTDKSRTPVFVHCQRGAERTGVMCAIYRIVVCGWSKEEAIREMVEGDFGFCEIFFNLVEFIRELNIDKIKQKAGLLEDKAIPVKTKGDRR